MTTNLNTPFASLTGARQTMMSWAKVIETFDAVPVDYRSSIKLILAEGQPFPHTVLAPIMAGLRHHTTEKLVCEANNTLYIWERIDHQVILTDYPLKTISDLEFGSILLFSWLTISGLTTSGVASTSTIEFNTSTLRHFAPFVSRIRPAPVSMEKHEERAEQAKFYYLETNHYKFMNFGIESLLDGEKVLHIFFQPKISKPILKLWGRVLIQNYLTLSHLVILTDKELIVVLEDERSSEERGVRYGGKWQYMALSHIRAVSLLDRPDGLLCLSLTLSPDGRRHEILFAASNKQEIERFKAELEKLIG